MSDHLVEIDQKEWPKLRDLYKAKGSNRYVAYMTIINYIRWFEQDPNLKDIKFYSLNGDFSDGSFIVIYHYFVFADTFDDSSDTLLRLMLLIDYSKGYHFSNVRTEVYAVIMRVVQKFSIDIDHYITSLLYYLPKEKALKFDVEPPSGVHLQPLTKLHDLEKINTMWKYGDETTLLYFQMWSKHNPNFGAFKDDGTLVAWIFQLESGLIGALQTDEKYYGHGYGALVTKCLSKKIAEMGFDVYAEIVEDNKASQSLFSKHGFEPVGKVHWILTNGTCSPDN